MYALVTHRDAVRDGDGAEFQRVAATGVNTLCGLRQRSRVEVAGGDLVPDVSLAMPT
jgi:hypothetical protein